MTIWTQSFWFQMPLSWTNTVPNPSAHHRSKSSNKAPASQEILSHLCFVFFFLPVLLRCNGHTALHKCKVCSKWFDGVHHEMILTISLVNVHHLPQTQNNRKRKHSSCDENSAPLLTFLSHHKPASRSQSGSSVQTTSSLGLGEWLPQQHRTGPWRFLGHLLPSGRMRAAAVTPESGSHHPLNTSVS